MHRVADDDRRMEVLVNSTLISGLFRGELLLPNAPAYCSFVWEINYYIYYKSVISVTILISGILRTPVSVISVFRSFVWGIDTQKR